MGQSGDPLVSVVIPTYYRNELLPDAVRSVREQTHSETEIIVVDASGEANAEPVVGNDSDVEYVPLDSDPGVQTTRSIGARRASGRFIQFLDDDDILREDKFERQIPVFSDTVGVVYSAIKIYETGEIKYPKPDNRGDVFQQAIRARLHEPAVTGSLLIKRSILDTILPLENDHGCDDDGLMLELSRRTQFDFVDEPLVSLRKETEHSLSGYEAGIEGRKRLLDEYENLYDRTSGNPRRDVLYDINRYIVLYELQRNLWSATALVSNVKTVYYASDPTSKAKRVALCLACLFGRPGLRFSNRLLQYLFSSKL